MMSCSYDNNNNNNSMNGDNATLVLASTEEDNYINRRMTQIMSTCKTMHAINGNLIMKIGL